MKLNSLLLFACSAFMFAGCSSSNQGAALTVENAPEYIQPLEEGVLNASYQGNTVTFRLYPNSNKGKLFSSDISGKCTVTVKYMIGVFVWSDPYTVTDVAFTYKAGGTEGEYKQADYLEASFTKDVGLEYTGVNVYNLNVTEITGHMQA